MAAVCLAAPILACSHSESFTGTDGPATGPFSSPPPVRLTYNPGNNYTPTWTEDGKGILYSFSYENPDHYADDRCVGLLPTTGGTRLWELCDTRREHADSADSFFGVSIAPDGKLLYIEMSTRRGHGGLSGVNQPPQVRALWLADTAFPFQRRKLVELSNGIRLNDRFLQWLTDTRWLSGTAFVALAKRTSDRNPWDSVGSGVGIIRGTIISTGATLAMIPGTEDARYYSLAEEGSSLIFIRDDMHLMRTPITGGTPVMVSTTPVLQSVFDLTCQHTTCLVTGNGVWRVDLVSGQAVQLADTIRDARLSPVTGDVVGTAVTSMVRIQIGGGIQPLSSIMLYHGVVP